jgi:anti-sigma B factor antagonist
MFSVEKNEKYALVVVNAEKLDSSVSPNLKSQLVVLNAEGFKNIIIDMAATRYCDSSGLSAILVANRLCKNSGGMFVLSTPQENVSKLITISQLDSILNMSPTLKDARDILLQTA